MIINAASITMNIRHQYQEKHEVSERLGFGVMDIALNQPADGPIRQLAPRDEVTLSPHSFSLNLLDAQIHGQRLDLETTLDAKSRVNLMILQAMFKQVSGRGMLVATPAELSQGTPAEGVALPIAAIASAGNPSSPVLIYERRERYQEMEQLAFEAVGTIKTADGRDISFSSSLTMRRDYYEESSLIVRQGAAQGIDPLVINFDGLGTELSNTRFAFDLDNDGAEEQIAVLRSGSGFLALDHNGDGIINNGGELFGPSTGRGFMELARYDEDGNHFIDEGDSIYSQLRIWMSNEDGSRQLIGLGDKNIGAIYLGHITSPFQLKDDANNSLGEVINSGIYLTESGDVGAVQEINLTV